MDWDAHERVVAAARAGLLKARELNLPSATSDEGVDHEYGKQIDRIERVVGDETEASDTLRAAVAKLLRTVKVLVPATVVLFIVCMLVGAFAFDSVSKQAAKTAALARENRRLTLEHGRTLRAAAVAVRKTAVQARVVIRQTCRRQNKFSRKLRMIIQRSEAAIPRYVAEGTLTRVQGDRALADARRARRDLHNERCSKRAARIPIP